MFTTWRYNLVSSFIYLNETFLLSNCVSFHFFLLIVNFWVYLMVIFSICLKVHKNNGLWVIWYYGFWTNVLHINPHPPSQHIQKRFLSPSHDSRPIQTKLDLRLVTLVKIWISNLLIPKMWVVAKFQQRPEFELCTPWSIRLNFGIGVF